MIVQHKAKVITIGNLILQPFTVDLHPYTESIVNDIFELYSNDLVLKYNMRRILKSLEEAQMHLIRIYNSYMDETAYSYLILDFYTKELLGEITLASPKGIEEWYPGIKRDRIITSEHKIDLANSCLIEYYLKPKYWGIGIIPTFADSIIQELFKQGCSSILAFCEKDNLASNKVLTKLDFKISDPKTGGDYYLWFRKSE